MTTAVDLSEIRDVLVSGVQSLGDRADDVRGRIPDAWQDGAVTVLDHLTDSVTDARSRVSHLAKDSIPPLVGSDRVNAAAGVVKDRRLKAVGVLLVLSFVLLLLRRRQQRTPSGSEV